jgi:hypothetical protein
LSKWEKWELLLIWEAEVRDDAKYTAMNTTSTKNQAKTSMMLRLRKLQIQALVIHTCSPSYLGGCGQEDLSSRSGNLPEPISGEDHSSRPGWEIKMFVVRPVLMIKS